MLFRSINHVDKVLERCHYVIQSWYNNVSVFYKRIFTSTILIAPNGGYIANAPGLYKEVPETIEYNASDYVDTIKQRYRDCLSVGEVVYCDGNQPYFINPDSMFINYGSIDEMTLVEDLGDFITPLN